MGMLTEFKEFAVKGNVVDMAIGVVIGGAFGKITASLVADVVMPPLGLLIGNVSFTDLAITLREANGDIAAVQLKYGMFLQTVFDFLIIAFAMFMVVRTMNRLKRKEEAKPAPAPAAPPKQEVLLEEIRDLLKARG